MSRRRIPGPVPPKPHVPEFPGSEELVRPRNEPMDVSPYLTQPHKTWFPDELFEPSAGDKTRGWGERFQAIPSPESVIPSHMSPGQFGPHHFRVTDKVYHDENGGLSRRVDRVYTNVRSPTSLEIEEPWRLEHPRLPGFDDNTGRLEPWQQTREEFAADPRSWHHASQSPDRTSSASIRRGLDLPNESHEQGLHLGTMQAALDRRGEGLRYRHLNMATGGEVADPVLKRLSDFDHATHNALRHPDDEEVEDTSSPIYSYRLREAPSGASLDQGTDWHGGHFGHIYNNEAEDPGSTSIVVRDRSALMSHHEAVNEALKSGKTVPDHVLAEYGVQKPWHALSPEMQHAYRTRGVAPVPTPIQIPTSRTHSREYMRALARQSSTGDRKMAHTPESLAAHVDEPPLRSVMPPHQIRPETVLSLAQTIHEVPLHEQIPSYLQGNLFHAAAQAAEKKKDPQVGKIESWRSLIHPVERLYQHAADFEYGSDKEP